MNQADHVSLREYFQQQIDWLRAMLDERYATQVKALDAAFEAQRSAVQSALIAQQEARMAALASAKEAVAKAEAASEKRFEGVNEFRAQLSDQAATFISRVEYSALVERVRELAARIDKTEGRSSGLTSGWGILVGAVGLIGAIVALIVR